MAPLPPREILRGALGSDVRLLPSTRDFRVVPIASGEPCWKCVSTQAQLAS